MQQKNKYIRIQEFLKQNKFPDFRMNQIKNAVFQGRINHFIEITVLPKSLRKLLIEEFGESILNIAPLKVQHSEQVTKVLFEISGDEKIETVNMKYKAGLGVILYILAVRLSFRLYILCNRRYWFKTQFNVR